MSLPENIEADVNTLAGLTAQLAGYNPASLSESGRALFRDLCFATHHALRDGRAEFDGMERHAASAILSLYAPPIETEPLIPQADNDAPQVEALGKPKKGRK